MSSACVPDRIVGSSIGAIIGAGPPPACSGHDIRDYMVDCFAGKSLVLGRLWHTRPATFQDFLADGGLRLGQLNAKRVVPPSCRTSCRSFQALKIPLGVMATDFYGKLECQIDTGESAPRLAATAALPALFRPVRRDGQILIDGGIFNPLPFDRLGKSRQGHRRGRQWRTEGRAGCLPTPLEAMFGASQLTMQSIIDTKVHIIPPDLLICPPVSHYGVLDFLRTQQILEETGGLQGRD